MKSPKDNIDDPSTLVDRLNGIYPAWVPGVYKPTPLNLEAAREIERLRAAAATPEVEPAAVVRGYAEGQHVKVIHEYRDNLPVGTKLYTQPNPPSDELVKAAEEVLRLLDGDCKDIRSTVETLRAALDKVKS
jgi:hypothetical protein